MFKKPKYIRKYDFIHYFCRADDEWFWSTNALETYIKEKIAKYDPTNMLINNDNYENIDEDTSYYDELKDFDDEIRNFTDPKIIEGNLIDQAAKKYIQDQYIKCKVHDFDLTVDTLNAKANKAIEILNSKDDVILFQPVFIYKNKAIAKLDALIRKNNIYTLIEVKGTTKPKYQYLVDIAYQSRIVNEVLNKKFNTKIDNYKLCLVAYTILKKNQIEFCFTNKVFLSKSSNFCQKQEVVINENIKFSKVYCQTKQRELLNPTEEITIYDLLNKQVKGKLNKLQTISYSQFIEPILTNEFDNIIERLLKQPINERPNLKPCLQHKSWLRDHEWWPLIHNYYWFSQKYFSMIYSGFIVKWKSAIKAYQQNINSLADWIQNCQYEKELTRLRFYLNSLQALNNYIPFKYGVYHQDAKTLLNKLKSKRVYYDFESIMLGTSVFDNAPPFLQTVVQVSLVVTNNKIIKAENIIIDPKNITIASFKNIVDAIYHGEEYSYVVYNKQFENARLKDMAYLINDENYSKKISTIIDNCFDLMDFFDSRKLMVIIQELYGHYSIKHVLRFINQHYPQLLEESGSKSYNDLAIHNGSEATNTLALRFLGYIDDASWKQKNQELKAYCENDVRAMIAVVLLLENIFGQKRTDN